jgi:hypothetical protein
VIIKVRALDSAPLGFSTVTEAVPCEAISTALIVAVSWVALPVVVRGAPFQRTTEPAHEIASGHRERKGRSACDSAAGRKRGQRWR